MNMPEWVLLGFKSGPLDPHFAPGSLKIAAPHLSEDEQFHIPPCALRSPSTCQSGPGVGQAISSEAVVPLVSHPSPSPLGPPWRHGGVLGLGTGQGFGASLRTWGFVGRSVG